MSTTETLATALPHTPGRWIEQVKPLETSTLWHDVNDGRLCIISIGDGCTALSRYTWQSTTRREDGLYEHIYTYSTGG